MTILDSIWFINVGIVKVELDGEIRFFIGTGYGFDRKMDERKVAEYGNSFDPKNSFFNITECDHMLPILDREQ